MFSFFLSLIHILLGGMDAAGYENTISIGQLKAQPGQPLAEQLKSFAVNYYAAGSSDLDLPAALAHLEERRKEVDRERKELAGKRQRRRERIEQEASYVWREIHGLVEEEEALEEEIHLRRERAREEEPAKKRVLDEIRPPKWRIHPVEILLFFLIVAGSFVLIHRPWNFLVAIVL